MQRYRAPRLDRISVRYDQFEDRVYYSARLRDAPGQFGWIFYGRDFEGSLAGLEADGTDWCSEIWREEVGRWMDERRPLAADWARPGDDRTVVYTYGGGRRQGRLQAQFVTAQERLINETFAVPAQYLGEAQRQFFGDNFRQTIAVRQEAEARGEKLLREWLSPEQLAQFERGGSFEVSGCHSGKRYRIVRDSSYNILELGADGAVVAKWCVVPAGGLVMGDTMLAQKIALETDERAALKVANRRNDLTPQRWEFSALPMVVDSRSWTGLT